MIVCHCRAVTDRAIRAAVSGGHTSVDAVMQETRAGTCCGGCLPGVEAILGKELNGPSERVASAPALRPLRIVQNSRAA